MKTTHPYYAISWDFNHDKMTPYDVMPSLLKAYNNTKKKPVTDDDIKAFIISESRYMFWSKCEYETILSSWPPRENGNTHKMDVHEQLMMNIDSVVECFKKNL